jgi:hypothetical protein
MATQTTASDLPKTLAELKGRKAIDFPHRLTLDPVSLDQYRLFGTRDWTDATISYEVENIESVTTDDAAFFQKIWNRFISVYRLKTNDSRILYFEDVGEPLRWSLGKIIYLPDEYSLSPNDRLGRSRTIVEFRDSAVNFPYAHEGFFEFDIRRATQDVFEFLKSDRSISLPEELLLKAHEAAYYRKNFRYALVEAFTAAEMCVSKYLNDLKVRRGESARSIDKFQDMPMARKLREVTLHFSNIDEHEKRIMGEIDWLRRERNVVVHEGKVLGHIEARRAVDAVQALFKIISARSIQ